MLLGNGDKRIRVAFWRDGLDDLQLHRTKPSLSNARDRGAPHRAIFPIVRPSAGFSHIPHSLRPGGRRQAGGIGFADFHAFARCSRDERSSALTSRGTLEAVAGLVKRRRPQPFDQAPGRLPSTLVSAGRRPPMDHAVKRLDNGAELPYRINSFIYPCVI